MLALSFVRAVVDDSSETCIVASGASAVILSSISPMVISDVGEATSLSAVLGSLGVLVAL
jgi:uncharacterized protein (UPF0264 family)